jgi:hypothetical protein
VVAVVNRDDYRGIMWWVTVAGRRSPGGCLMSIGFTLFVIVVIVEGFRQGWFR